MSKPLLSNADIKGMSKEAVRDFYEALITTGQLLYRPWEKSTEKMQKQLDRLWDKNHLMTYKEAAMLYGLSYQTIRVYVCNGIIKSFMDGAVPRITHAAMQDYLKGKKIGGRRTRAQIQQQLLAESSSQ